MLPSRIILWLDDASAVSKLPEGLRSLQERGLEIRPCKDYGPHKKYYPYLESLQEAEIPLVTADDDLLYPRYWLKDLIQAFRQFPDVVNCHRARVIRLDQDCLAKYHDWAQAESTEPSFRNFSIGVGGAIYPPHLQSEVKRAGVEFLNCCPRADDVWLHVQALRAGYKVRQISEGSFRLIFIPGTQDKALHHQNLDSGGNDLQIAKTYSAADMERLRDQE
jgi:hypothetical protein